MALHYSSKVLRHRQHLLATLFQTERALSVKEEQRHGYTKPAETRKLDSSNKHALKGKSASDKNCCDANCLSKCRNKSLKSNSLKRSNAPSNFQTMIENVKNVFINRELDWQNLGGNQIKRHDDKTFTLLNGLKHSLAETSTPLKRAVHATLRAPNNVAQRTLMTLGSSLCSKEVLQRSFFSTTSETNAAVTIETAERDKERLLAEISEEVGSPDWVKILRDFTFTPFREDMEDFVDLVGFPYMERYLSDEKWVMESLMVLLVAMEVNRLKNPGRSAKPTVRQTTISSVLMMIRLMNRIHQEMNDTTFPDQGDVGNDLMQSVLIGDMVAGTYLRAAADLKTPKVTEVLLKSGSALQCYFMNKLHPTSIEGVKSPDQAKGQYDHLRDDIPEPFVAACEAIVIDAGLDQKLQERLKKFAYHISLARSLNRGLDVFPDGQPTSSDLTSPKDAKAHSDLALNGLAALSYPESKSLLMLKRLARAYAAV
ncbi:hypothetical protein ElyMa_005479000 [Elysia marginata]|uniref:Uncharacterized protein n=1 Tax=Elysia marginata TaxID=1093978 RepID=A0AAV4ERC8_9GAST|nr:hypothetical protein ElyMa_005479000 [Elysia marginata]